jgi:cyclophilin family peptidyl-prolyl cis-trans isomerase
MSATKKAVAFLILVLFTFSTPGCLEDLVDETELYQGESSTVTMEIVHAESAANATLTYTIEIELYHDAAPNHADNFRKHAQQGNYDNVTFHRIIDDFMIQGGDFERHDGTGGYAVQWYGYCNGEAMEQASDCSSETLYTLPDEANNNLTHVPCMLSMAKTSQPNTGGSQFFIMPDDITQHTWLDGVHTVFGKVISGCEHVTTLSEVETGQNDRPVVPVIIVSATASE